MRDGTVAVTDADDFRVGKLLKALDLAGFNTRRNLHGPGNAPELSLYYFAVPAKLFDFKTKAEVEDAKPMRAGGLQEKRDTFSRDFFEVLGRFCKCSVTCSVVPHRTSDCRAGEGQQPLLLGEGAIC